MIKLDINIGDTILVGRFKNKRIEVKEIGVDEHGSPTVNGKSILKIRIEKLMKTKKNLKEAKTITSAERTKIVNKFSHKCQPNVINAIIDEYLDGKSQALIAKITGADFDKYVVPITNMLPHITVGANKDPDDRKGDDPSSKQYYDRTIKRESKQIKEAIDYEDEIVAPSWLIRDREYVWIMGAEPLLVIYTGPGKKPGSKNFKFKEKPAVNHDLSPRDVKKYIRYKVGEAPGPFGYDDSPLGGLNKFKNPLESKQISLAGIAKTILKTK